MARPANPDSQYIVKPHQVGGHTYASTQPWHLDPATGRKVYRYVHWGTVTDMVFYPNARFIAASPEERARLLFPPSWDLSEINRLSSQSGRGRPSYNGPAANRLYGHIWLLEQVAERTGIRSDLESVFNGNKEMVDIVMTLAMFPYLTKFSYNRLERWQRTDRAPYCLPLPPGKITLFTQSITEAHRLALLNLRAKRLRKDELCAVDSTTRSAYGDSLADIHWGKNKEGLPLRQTTEVVVYTLEQHMPVYYRTFPGNMNDARSLKTILTDIDHAGFANLAFITDRGYESLRNTEEFIQRRQKAVMCVKTSLKMVQEEILAFGDFITHPDEMEIDPETRLYMTQYKLEYQVQGQGNCVKAAADMRLNLYFEPVRRSNETVELDIAVKEQGDALAEMLAGQETFEDLAALKKRFSYYELDIDAGRCRLRGYARNEKKLSQARRLSGFFAIVTLGLDWDPKTTFMHYKVRDEQEKYFEQMKDQMVADRQRNWSEEGKTGRLFILFVSLVLGSYVRHIWRGSALHKMFSSSLDILDEMRPIRCVEHPKRAKFLTPFIGRQLDICAAFGFDVPKGCDKVYVSRKVDGKKRGRPRKAQVVQDL